jgi:hypothetical protein
LEASDKKIEKLKDDLLYKAANRMVLMNTYLSENAAILGFTLDPENLTVPFKNSATHATKFF